ncbi:metal-sulfur cluster assembly factor [Candidatus Sulfidibacterium hydrothermale]|uniref:metal-sulfur cluster assembly factor n=1 Tax=Candidatus Sulfidibacterium hydrothermale TaxID=2875962 RepID=UPI001F0A14C0|nr:metal-sulfur cluster assembly factor [Candidatus Sulfidibacterium hydrothermale]UBM61752.1 metal-sulfur cluster assembly factor [Candidatus Sulfidibacterium hydrothermale]
MSDIHHLTEKEKEIAELLKTVIDPEVAVNIIDLGLVYEIDYNEEEKTIKVVMTLSTRGCPLGDTIMQNVEVVLQSNYPDFKIEVELVWEPMWSPEMITEAGRQAIEGF